VRLELAPWEAKMQEAQGAINIAKEERDLLTRRQRDAEKALQQALEALEAAKQGAKAKEKQIAELSKAMDSSRWAAPGGRWLAAAPC
jgi:chromosome segregation ATPase